MFLAASGARAQGGPPMQTDDPETVEPGKWEINLALIGESSDAGRSLESPRFDINYGLVEGVQLKWETPLVSRTAGGDRVTGWGQTTVGTRWRFFGADGIKISIYPQYTFDLLASSARRGVTSGDAEFFFPVEIAGEIGSYKLGAEVGRTLVESAADEWVAGLVAGADCMTGLECLAEIRDHLSSGQNAALLNFGARATLAPTANLLVSVGHGVGPDSPERPDWAFYLAVQLLR